MLQVFVRENFLTCSWNLCQIAFSKSIQQLCRTFTLNDKMTYILLIQKFILFTTSSQFTSSSLKCHYFIKYVLNRPSYKYK